MKGFLTTMPEVSVIICTYKRLDALNRLLAYLMHQTFKDFEVIIVNQGEVDIGTQIITPSDCFFKISYFHTPNIGLPNARNMGIKLAKGEIVLFLDDDVIPDKNLIQMHLDNYSDPHLAGVGGRIILEDKYSISKKTGQVRHWDAYLYFGFDSDKKNIIKHLQGSNMSFRRNIALENGPFDIHFGGDAIHEEADFCLRLNKIYKLIFEPKAMVRHLRLSQGGCRLNNRQEHIYWLYHNHNLLFLKNFNKLFYPLLFMEYILRIIIRSLKWRDFKVIKSGLKGIKDAWKDYLIDRCKSCP